MPVYNAEQFVAEAVESILNQTFGNFEFLILDDGSTDGSLEILRRYADRDPRIHLTSRANKGVVASLNELLDQARGEFIARMDADDVAMPERFQKQVDFLRATPGTSWSEARCKSSTPRGIPLCEWCTVQDHEVIDSTYLRGEHVTVMSHPSIMMYRDAVLAVGKYHPIKTSEDVDLFLRLAEYGRIANIPRSSSSTATTKPTSRTPRRFTRRLTGSTGRSSAMRIGGGIFLSCRCRRRRSGRSPEAETPPPETQQNNTEIWAWCGLRGTGPGHARRVLA